MCNITCLFWSVYKRDQVAETHITIYQHQQQTVPTEGGREGDAERAPTRCQLGSVGGAGHGRAGRVSWGGASPPPYRARQLSLTRLLLVYILSTSSCGLPRPTGACSVRKTYSGCLAAAAGAAPMQGTTRPNSSGVRRKYHYCSTASLQPRGSERPAWCDQQGSAGSLEELLVTLPL
ncbi:hypothetical protein E2C01_051985 [Portunus trituberculatus]|uniref:Uncharacterized protein n=1 Tax=Portunus trituberculatus TaxID=210409 RepID=A0A5B7GKH8_PORTR|nr:hypothetical protein [Portunus trituberculatus]